MLYQTLAGDIPDDGMIHDFFKVDIVDIAYDAMLTAYIMRVMKLKPSPMTSAPWKTL